MSVLIGGVQKTSLIDFPAKISSIVFLRGCNFKCGYCHNPELLGNMAIAPFEWSEESFFEFLLSRKNKLDGVVVTGGEPTLQKDLFSFIEKIKQMGFAVKLDTNGTNPDIVQNLIDNSLLDYIAMDIKAPYEKYEQITNSKVDLGNIQKSIKMLIEGDIPYEFRTTALASQLNMEDFDKIVDMISGAEKYYIQKFVPTKIIDSSLLGSPTVDDEMFQKIKFRCGDRVKNIYLR